MIFMKKAHVSSTQGWVRRGESDIPAQIATVIFIIISRCACVRFLTSVLSEGGGSGAKRGVVRFSQNFSL